MQKVRDFFARQKRFLTMVVVPVFLVALAVVMVALQGALVYQGWQGFLLAHGPDAPMPINITICIGILAIYAAVFTATFSYFLFSPAFRKKWKAEWQSLKPA